MHSFIPLLPQVISPVHSLLHRSCNYVVTTRGLSVFQGFLSILSMFLTLFAMQVDLYKTQSILPLLCVNIVSYLISHEVQAV